MKRAFVEEILQVKAENGEELLQPQVLGRKQRHFFNNISGVWSEGDL